MIIREKFRGFDWLASVFYPLVVILMESFWVYPWLAWIGLWPTFSESRPVLSLAAVLITLALSLVITRIMLKQSWPMRYIQAAVVGGGMLVILLVLGVDYASGYGLLSGEWFTYIGRSLWVTFKSPHTIVAALPVMIYLWWRGIRLGNSTSLFNSIYKSFLLGMVALIVLIILWQISSGSKTFTAPGGDIGLYVMAFFFFGLLAVAICQLYTMRRSMPKEEAGLTSIWRWLPMMLGIVGGMIVVGFIVAGVFSADFFAQVARAAGALHDFFGKLLDYLLVPFSYLFEAIIVVIRWFIALIRTDEPLEPQMPEGGPFDDVREITPAEIPPIVSDIARWILILVILTIIVFILAKAVSRLRAGRKTDEIEEIHESLWSMNTLKDDLKEFLNSLGKRFQRKPAAPKYRFDDMGRLDVRDIYKHLQWEAARSGMPRRRHETADEYASRLGKWVPDGTDPLEGITDLYTKVRYGEIKVPEKQVDSANTFWATLRGLLRRIRGDS